MYEDVDRTRIPCQSGRQTADPLISNEVGLEPVDLPRAPGGLGRHRLQSQPIAPHSDNVGRHPEPAEAQQRVRCRYRPPLPLP